MLSTVWPDIRLQEMSIWDSYLWNKMISMCQYWNNGSQCYLEMGTWSGVVLMWLVLMSLSAPHATSLITTEYQF